MVKKETEIEKPQFTLSGVWKVASFLLAYLIMGVWITAQISEANKGIRHDIQNMREDIKHLTVRMDNHIDNEGKKDGN